MFVIFTPKAAGFSDFQSRIYGKLGLNILAFIPGCSAAVDTCYCISGADVRCSVAGIETSWMIQLPCLQLIPIWITSSSLQAHSQTPGSILSSKELPHASVEQRDRHKLGGTPGACPQCLPFPIHNLARVCQCRLPQWKPTVLGCTGKLLASKGSCICNDAVWHKQNKINILFLVEAARHCLVPELTLYSVLLLAVGQ